MVELLASNMETEPGYNWFVILCSWELEAEDEAVERFNDVYEYLNILRNARWLDEQEKLELGGKDTDTRYALDRDSLKALNLIGRRKFVFVFQSKSHKILLELSKRIGLNSPIKVEVLPAVHVHDVYGALKPKEETR